MKKTDSRPQTSSIKSNTFFVAGISLLCTIMWGSAFPCIKIGYELFRIDADDIPSKLIFAGARFLLAGLIVLVIGIIKEKSKMKLHRRDILPIAALGFFQTYMQYLLLYIGLVRVSGTKSAVLTSVSTFGSVIISALVFKSDKLTQKKMLGCVIGLTGIIIMNSGGDGLGGFLLLGDGLVILSNLSGAAGNVLSKKISTGRTPVQISAWQLILGGSSLILTGIVCGGRLVFYEQGCIWLLLYLAAMAGVAFMLWTMLLFHNDVSRVAVYNLLIPVFGAMWSAIFLSENIFTVTNILALALVCSGIFIVNFKRRKKTQTGGS